MITEFLFGRESPIALPTKEFLESDMYMIHMVEQIRFISGTVFTI
jgi:hypothetical protein